MKAEVGATRSSNNEFKAWPGKGGGDTRGVVNINNPIV